MSLLQKWVSYQRVSSFCFYLSFSTALLPCCGTVSRISTDASMAFLNFPAPGSIRQTNSHCHNLYGLTYSLTATEPRHTLVYFSSNVTSTLHKFLLTTLDMYLKPRKLMFPRNMQTKSENFAYCRIDSASDVGHQ